MANGAPAAVDVGGVRRKLLGRQGSRGVVRLLGVIFGMPLLFLAPVVLGSMFWLSCGLLYQWYPWANFFWGTAAVAIPALFITELRTAGGFLSAAISPEEGRRARTGQAAKNLAAAVVPGMSGTLALAAAIAAPRASMAGFIELFLTGPRFLLAAYRHGRMMVALRGVDRQRAALLLYDLHKANIGMGLQQLLHKGEKMGDLVLPLSYLVFYDWAGVAADGSKAWILTEAKKDLGDAVR